MSLTIHNLSKSFGRKTIFSGFSYSFADNGVYILCGESGIGKTTLLRMIAGLDKSFDGEILGGGIGNVSFVFQEYRLFPGLTALENVMISCENADSGKKNEAMALLSELGFTEDDMRLLPHELSGGMKQRVSLARAFFKKAPVYILDEPTKELDSALCNKVCEMVMEISRSSLVILVTHKSDDIERLDGTEIHL